MVEDLPQIVHLRAMAAGSVPIRSRLKRRPKPGERGVLERVGPVRAVELDRAEEQVDAAFPGARDQPVEQVEVIVGDQVARAVRGFPVTPEGEPQSVQPIRAKWAMSSSIIRFRSASR